MLRHTVSKVFYGFLSLITAGSLLLWAFGLIYKIDLNLLDAIFTAVSAVCTTGLTVIDLSRVPLAFQIVVAVLIQCGGIGIMSIFAYIITKKREYIIKVWVISILIEILGIIPLYWAFQKSYPPIRALRYAAFHSVSAFCNAGFSLFSNNLTPYVRGLAVSGMIMMLVVIGGLGFIVLEEIWNFLWHKKRISGRSLLAIQVTFCLIIVGTVLIFLAERQHSLKDLPPLKIIWNALFFSISSRTGGFNTAPMGLLSGTGMFILVFLMTVGASPGSTGGGLKTTHFGILVLAVSQNLMGRKKIAYHGQIIATNTIISALSLAALYMMALLGGTLLLAASTEGAFSLRALFFEAVSAIGNSGLSLGITPVLPNLSKIIVILLMLLGRVGMAVFIINNSSEITSRAALSNTNSKFKSEREF